MILSRLKSILFLIVGGVLCASAFAPFDFIIGVMIGIIPLLMVEESISNAGARKKTRVFWSAYLFFAVFNFCSIWWVAFASPIGVIASVIVNSMFFAFVTLLYSIVKRKVGARIGYISFIVFWLGWEYVELIDWDLSWPWINLGHSLSNWPKLIQWYSILGSLGGSLWILLINLYIFFAIKSKYDNREEFITFKKSLLAFYFVLFPIIGSMIMFYTYDEKGGEADVVVLQPNMHPYEGDRFIREDGSLKNPLPSAVQVAEMLKMGESQLDDSVDLFIMHETALPRTESNFTLGNSVDVGIVKRWRKRNFPDLNILTGIAYRDFKTTKIKNDEAPASYKKIKGTNRYFEYFNSSVFISNADTMAQYHKSRLVIGVERIPSYFVYFQRYLEDFDDNPESSEFNPNNGIQKEREVFITDNDSIHVAPIICYESLFGEYVTDYVSKGANLLAIITNDAWWRDTPGHKQHWSFAKMRAIETRRSIARSANTGWSGFINQRGEEIQRSEYFKPAVMRQKVRLNSELTFFVKYGDIIGRWSLGISIYFLLNLIVKYIKGRERNQKTSNN